MKKRRKTLSFLLAFSLALGSFGSAPFGFAGSEKVQAAALEEPSGPLSGTFGAQGDNITWELKVDPDGIVFPEEGQDTQPTCYELVFTGTGEWGGDKSWANEKPWEDYCKVITSVTINEGITSIGGYTF